ncbi:hypothetical protein Bca101_055593 [Brassica carinata]
MSKDLDRQIYAPEKIATVYNRSKSPTFFCERTTIFIDSNKLEDATTRSSQLDPNHGEEREHGDSDQESIEQMKRRSIDREEKPGHPGEKPVKTVLSEPPLPGDKSRRSRCYESHHFQRQSQTLIGGADATPESRTGRKHRNRYTKRQSLFLSINSIPSER